MKVLIIDKDGVLNPNVFMLVVRWGFFNVSPMIMLRLLSSYIVLKKIRDDDMLYLEKFFENNKQFSKPPDTTVFSLITLRKKYDKIILLTNGGTGKSANERIISEITNYYPSGIFDEIIVQSIGQSKGPVYKKWHDAGHDVTVIDDSDCHTQIAMDLGIKNVIKIGKKPRKSNNVFESLLAYVEST